MTGPGELLGGRYRLDDRLGSGGMADVFRGWDLRLGRAVAIKILRTEFAEDQTFRRRFQREARHSAALNHPAIVAVHDTGDDRDDMGRHTLFIVMELIEGRTLRQILAREGPLPPARVLPMVAEICAALDFSHQRGIVHRDVKPGNVMITASGQVKVMDFGIALALSSSPITPTGGVIGTAFYLSPEQANAEAVDQRSDVYSIGCVLFEALCGEPPFVCDNPVAVAYRHITERPAVPHERNSAIPEAVSAVILKSLAKDPADRQQSAEELRRELLACVEASDSLNLTRDLPSTRHPVFLLPPPQLFPGSTALMTRAEVDDALVSLGADHDRITIALYMMESHPGGELIAQGGEGEDETGGHGQRHLRVRVRRVWAAFAVFFEVLGHARDLRRRRARPARADLVELTWILRGASIAVMAGQSRVGERITVAQLRERIERECEELVTVLTRLVEAKEETDALEERRARERAAAVEAIRQSVVDRLEALRSLLEVVGTAERAAATACGKAQIKIADSGVVSPEPRSAELSGRLVDLVNAMATLTKANERGLSPLVDAITDLESDVAEALAVASAAESSASGLIARRDELRGRVRAYHARAIRLGQGEDVDLSERYREARDLLWQAPCDLSAATMAVLRYQQGIRGEKEPR